MKPSLLSHRGIRICALPFAALFAVSASAANISWTGATDAVWSTGENWVGGVAPVAAGFAVFDANAGADFSMQGLKISTPEELITIGGLTNTLTIGAGGAGLNISLQDLQLSALVALAADHSRSAITEKTLTASAVISGTAVNLSRIGIADLTLSGPSIFAGAPTFGGGQFNDETGNLTGTKVEKLAFTDFGMLSIGAAPRTNRGLGELRMSDGSGGVRSANQGGKRTVKISSRGVSKAGVKEEAVISDETAEELRAALELKEGIGPLLGLAGAEGLTLRDSGFGNTDLDTVSVSAAGIVTVSNQNLGRQYVTTRLVPLVSPPLTGAWTGATDANWLTGTNWSGGTAPGTGETAIFNAAAGAGGATISLGAGVTVNTISFETSSAAAYTIGSGAAGSQSLTLNNGGGITMGFGVTNTEIVNSNIVLGTDGTAQIFTITSNNTFATSKQLTLNGAISGSAGSGIKTLNVISNGVQSNTGQTISILGAITDGAGGGTVKLVKDGDGTLQIGLGTTTNTYSGGTYLNAGTLTIVGAGSSLKANTSLFIAGGTTLNSVNALGTFSGIVQQWNGDFSFGDSTRQASTLNSMTFNTGSVDLGATGTDTVRTINTLAQTLTVNSAISDGTNTTTIGLTKTGAGTLVLGGNNAYTGKTTVNAGTLTITGAPTGVGASYAALGSGTLTISGAAGTISASSAITIAGGNLQLINASTAEGSVNRLNNTTAITSNGGTLTYNNTSGSGLIYAENVGNVTLNGGQLNIVLSTNMAGGGGNIQTLTLNSLTQSNRSTVTFAAATTTPNATTNIIKVNGASATAANQIIGPWATVGTSAAVQTDYVVYDAAGNIVAANIAGSLDSTWTNSANAYTSNYLGGGAANALGAVTHNMATLRNLPAFGNANTATTIVIPTGGNLNTFGLLNANQGLWTINQVTGSTGALSTPTGGGSLYINTGNGTATGNGAITIGAPINDNGGAVSIVKTGTGFSVGVGQGVLTLSNVTSNYTGATVINGGAIVLNTSGALANGGLASSLGSASISADNLVLNGGFLQYGTATTAVSTNRLFSIGAMGGTIDSSAGTTATMSFVGTGAMGFASQTGPRTLTLQGSNVGVAASTSGSDSSLSTIALLIGDNSGATSLTKTGAGTWALTNSASTYTGPTTITGGILNVGTFAAANTASSLGKGSATTLATDLVLNGGTLQYSNNAAATTDRLFSLGTVANSAIDSSAASPTNTLSLTATGAMGFNNNVGARTLNLLGTNTGANSLGLLIGDFGGATALTKGAANATNTGTWILANNANTYTGVTTINSGILSVGKLANGGSASGIGASTNVAANLVLNATNTSSPTTIGALVNASIPNTGSSAPILQYSGSGDSTDRLFTITTGGNASRFAVLDASGFGALNFTNAGSPVFTTANQKFTLVLSGSNTGNNTFAGVIPNNGTTGVSVVKNGTGTWILSGNNTYSDAAGTVSDFGTTVNQGTLVLSGSPTAATALKTTVNAGGTLKLDYTTNTSKLSDTGILTLAGGTLNLSGGSHAEVVVSTTLNPGASSVIQTNSGTSTLLMNAIARNPGAMLDLPVASVASTDTNNAASVGILGAWATVAGANWAKSVDSGAADTAITAYTTGYTDIDALGSTIANSANTNVRLNSAAGSGNITMGSATTAINTLLQNTTTAATIDTTAKTLQTTGIMIGDGKASLTIGLPAGTGSLQAAASAGDLVLNNASNYSGTNSGKTLTVNVPIILNGASTLTTAGNVTLNGVNTYTGATFVNSGTLTIAGSGGLSSSSAITIASGATLNYTSTANQTLGATSGFGNFIWNPSNGTAVLTPGARGATPAVLTIKSGGVAILASNLGTGPASDLVLDGGALRFIGGGGGGDNGTHLFTLGTGGGGVLVPAVNSRTSNLTGTGAIAFAGSGTRTLNFDSAIGGKVNIFTPALGDGPGGATSVTMGGILGATGIQAGTWALNGTNTYTGTTTVNGGSLLFRKVQSANNGVAYFTPTNVTVVSGAGLGVGVGPAPTYFDSTAIATILDNSHLGASTATTGLKTGAMFGMDTTGSDFTYRGTLTDLSGGNVLNLAKYGGGILTLSGNNTYTGTTTVYGDTADGGGNLFTSILRAGTSSSITNDTGPFGKPSTASIVYGSGGYGIDQRVQLFGNNVTVIGLNAPNNGTTVGDGGSIMYLESGSSDTSGTGVDILTVNNVTTSTWATQSGNNGPIATIRDGSTRKFGLSKGGVGTLFIGTPNTYTGGTIINAGILQAGNATAFGTATTAAIAFGTGSTGTLQLNGNSMTIVGLNTDPVTIGTPIVEAGATGATLTINPLTTSPSTYAGVLRNNSGSGGVLTLTIGGPGTLTLSGDNTYTGTTTLSGGTLILSGNNSGATGNMSISAGAIAQFNASNSILGSGRNVTDSGAIVFGPSFGAGNIASALLTKIVAGSTGTIAADNYAGTNFDFNTAGLTAASLGAVGTVNYTGALTPNAGTYRLGGGGGTLTYPTIITGSALTITGAGTGSVVLSNNSNTLGTLTVSSGILDLNATTGQTAGAVTFVGGTVQNGTITGASYAGTGGTVTASLGGAATFTNSSGITTLNANNSGYSGAINITGGTLRAVDRRSLGSGLVTLSGAGALTLLNDGAGAGLGNGMVQSISYGNSITTGTNTITVGQFTNSGVFNAANKILQLNNLTINANQTEFIVNPLNGFGLEFTGTTTIPSGQVYTIFRLPGNVAVTPAPLVPNLTLSGKISGTGPILVDNGLTLLLTNPTNDFTGGIGINGGIITITSNEAAGALSGKLNLSPINGAGPGIKLDGTFSTARTIQLPGVNTGSIYVTQGNMITYSGNLDTTAADAFTKGDNGIFKITSDLSAPVSNKPLNFFVNGGAILVSHTLALGTTAGSTTVANSVGAAVQLDALTLDGGTIAEPFNISSTGINTGGALQAVGGTQANPRSISTSGVITLGSAATIGADAFTTLNIGTNSIIGTQALTLAGAGNINISTALPALGSLTKIGSGTTNLSAASTGFVQALTVNVGTLTLSGAAKLGNASSATVNPGGTLTLDNSGTSTDSRLGGTTRTLTLNGGTFNFIGNGTTESIGNLIIGNGRASITTNGSGTLTFAALGAVDSLSAVDFPATGPGVNFTTLPGLSNGILQRNFFVGGEFATLSGSKVVPYTTYAITNPDLGNYLNGLADNQGGNAVIKASGTQTTIAFTSPNGKRIGGVNLTAGAGITFAPGMLLTFDGALINNGGGNITGGKIDTGTSATLIFNYLTDGSVSSVIDVSSGNGFVKTGAGNLTLTSLNPLTRATYIQQGTLTLAGGNNTLATNKGMVLNNGGTLALGSNNQYLGSLTSTGSVEGSGGTITGSGTLITNGTNGTFAGNIGGSINFVKAGANTMILSSAQSTSGTISVIGGGLTLKDGATLLGTTGGITLNGATLTIDNTGTKDIADRVNNSAITMNSGTIIFNGRTQSNSTESFGAVTANTGASVFSAVVGGTGVNSAQLTLSGLTRSTGATIRMDGSNLGTIGNNPRIVVIDALSGNLTPVNGVIPGVFSQVGADNTHLVGYVSGLGFGALGTSGFPAYYSPGGNNFSGATAASNVQGAGTVAVGGQTINSIRNGTISFLGATDTFVLNSGMFVQGSNASFGIGSTSIRGRLTSGLSTGELFLIKYNEGGGGGAAGNIHSVIADNGGTPVKLVITQMNRDDLQNQRANLTANNTYTGGTVVSGGNTLLLGSSIPGWTTIPAANDPTQGLIINNSQVTMQTNAGQIAASNIVTLNGGSTLTYAGNNTQAGFVFNSNGGTATPTINGFNILTLTGSITSTPANVAVVPTISGTTLDLNDTGHNITVDGGSTTSSLFHSGNGATVTGLTISSIISSASPASGSITKLGTGVLQLSGVNVFTGGLTIGDGTSANAGAVIAATSGNSLGGSGNVVTLNNGALWLNTTVNGGQTIVVSPNGGKIAMLADATLAQNITLNGALAISLADPTLNNTDRQLTYSAAITGTGSVTVTGNVNNPFNATPKPLLLTNATSQTNTFSGGLTIGLGGRVKPSAAYNIGSITGSLTVNSGGVLDLNNTAQTVGNFTGTGGLITSTGSPVFTIGYGSSATTGNFAGVIAIGTGSLVKTGTGTITLSGTNTYTGGTNVSQGALALDFTTATTAAPVLATTGILTLAGGTLDLRSGVAQIQVVASTSLNGGLSNVTQSTGSSILRMNAITPGVGVVNFSEDNFASTTNTNNAAGILGGWAIAGGTTWAVQSASVENGSNKFIVAYTGAFADVNRLGGTITSAAASNVRIVEGGGGTEVTPFAAGTTDIATLLQNANGGTATYNPGTTDILRLGAAGGILVPSGAGALTIGTTAGDGKLTAGGTANTAGTFSLTNNSANLVTINSIIENNGSGVVGLGTAGNVLLNGVNTYTGNTGVGNGTLEIGGSGQLGGGNYAGLIQIGGSGTLKVNSSANQTLSGVISGIGGLVKDGAGTLSFSQQQNTYSGNTIVNGGILAIGNRVSGDFGVIRGTLTINNGAKATFGDTLGYANASTTVTVVNINGGTFEFQGAGNGTFTGVTVNMTGGLFSGTGSNGNGPGILDLFLNGNVGYSPGSFNTFASANTAEISAHVGFRSYGPTYTVADGAAATDLLVSGNLSSFGTANGLTKAGAGLMAITSNNTNSTVHYGDNGFYTGYTGATLISAGTLQLGNNTATGSLNPLSAIVNNGTFAFNRTNTLTQGTDFNSVISGTGGISQVGSGTTVLNGTNTYTGLTLVTAGTLSYGASNVIATGAVTVNGATAILDLGASRTDSVGMVTLDGGGSITGTGTSALTSTGSFEMKSGSVSAILAGSGIALNKTTAGTVTLSGANTYSGTTTLSAGTLVISGSPTAGGAVTINGGTLRLDYGTNETTKIADGAVLTLSGGVLELAGGTHTEIVGSTTIAGGASSVARSSGTSVLRMNALSRNVGATINFSTNDIASTSTANDASGILGVWATVGGTDWAMNSGSAEGSGNNYIRAYTGYADIDAQAGGAAPQIVDGTGNVRILNDGVAGAIGLSATTTSVNSLLKNNVAFPTTVATAGKTLRVNAIMLNPTAESLTLGTVSNDGTLTSVISSGSPDVTLINNSASKLLTVNAVIANNTVASTLNKLGTGTVVLGGANTFSGTTTISVGVINMAKNLALQNSTVDVGVNNNAVTFAAGITNPTLGGLQGSGGITLATAASEAATLNVGGNGATTTYSGALSGAGGLTKSGAGTLVLMGANTYGGITTVVAGTLQIGNGGTAGNLGGGNVTDNGSLVFNRSDALTISNTISGSGSLTQSGTGTLTLSGANAFVGAAILSAGTLSVGADNNLGDANPVTFDGGTLQVTGTTLNNFGLHTPAFNIGKTAGFDIANAANTFTLSQAMNQGGGGLTKSGVGTLVVTGANIYSGITTVSAGVLQIGNGGNTGSLGSGNVIDNGSLIFNRSDALTVSNVISGSGSLTQSGAGTLTLGGANTFSGFTTLSTGTLSLGSGTAIGTGTLIISGGALDSAVASLANANNNPQNWNGDFTFVGTNSLNLGTGAVTMSATRTVTVAANTLSVGGSISGAGLTKAGAGTLLLGGANTFVGATTLSAGTLSVSADANLGSANALIFDGGTLQITGSGLNNFGAHTPTFNTGKTVALDIASAANTFTIAQILNQGAGGLTKTGPGTLVLTGANTYNGITTLSAGTLQIGNGGTTGGLGSGNVIDNGSLIFNRSDAFTVSNNISGNGTLTQNGVGTVVLGGTNSFTGATTINAGTLSVGADANLGNANALILNGGALQITGTALTSYAAGVIGSHPVTLTAGRTVSLDIATQANTFTVSQVLNQGTGGLTKLGAGTLVLGGTNTFTGATTLSVGTLSVGADANLGNGNAVVFNGGTLQVTGTTLNLYEAGKIGTHTVTLTSNTTVGFDIANAANNFIVSQPLNQGTGGLNKFGPGTLALTSGANSYSGDTNVYGGTLAANVSGTISGSTIVQSGGTLAGDGGTFGNVTVKNGGTFAPGRNDNPTGTLTLNGNLLLETSSNFNVQFDIGAGFVDAITVNGNLNITSAPLSNNALLNVSYIGQAPVEPGPGDPLFPNDIITYSGAWNGGTFLGLGDDSTFESGGIHYLISYNDLAQDGVNHAVTLTVVPEPGAAVTLLGGLGILLGLRRRRA